MSLKVLRDRAARTEADPSPAAASLKESLGPEGTLDLDPLTSTPRFVGRTDGFLSGPSAAPAATVALDYVTRNAPALGTANGLGALELRRDYVDIGGTHHLSWVQTAGGVPLFGNGLKANVTSDGRLISVSGSPVPDLRPATAAPKIDANGARARAKHDAGVAIGLGSARSAPSPVFADGDASLVLFQTVDGSRLAWQTTVTSDLHGFQSVIDAETGAVLFRRSLVNHAHGLAFDNYPQAPRGGEQRTVDFTAKGWLPPGAATLAGNNSHAYADVDGDDIADATEEVGPDASGNWDYPLTIFNDQPFGCSETYPCTWVSDPVTGGYSWETNRKQAVTQLFSFVNTFHDHLLRSPIGFTEAAGNFQQVNASGQGMGGDAILAEALDGANTLRVNGALVGLPDPHHVNNAYMMTPPDGQPARLVTFLVHDPSNPRDPFLAANMADDADVVYHEYTHGLSNRLVVDAFGNSTLYGFQPFALGEAWSDWYAFDFQVAQGYDTDTVADGDLREGDYVQHGIDRFRRQPIDCKVGSTSSKCQGGTRPPSTAGPGGFTFGDYGRIRGYPQAHADGEIFSETLWDLRDALGSPVTQALVTRAMELSPNNPTFLDERNAILQADLVNFGGAHRDQIWSVFAQRGMGWFASTLDFMDTEPIEDFHVPPPPGTPFGKLRGRVLDKDTGKPAEGVRISLSGHDSGFPGALAAMTKQNGTYEIKRVPAGTYPQVVASGGGYDRVVLPAVSVQAGDEATTLNWEVRRDWASLFGGGSVVSFTGPDYSPYGCGPQSAIDQVPPGWVSDTLDQAGHPATPHIVVALPQVVDVIEFGIDPTPYCVGEETAATMEYRIETSGDAVIWRTAAEGAFDLSDLFRLNVVKPAAPTTGVRYVRFTILSAQLPVGHDCATEPVAGCFFVELSEIEVYGRPVK